MSRKELEAKRQALIEKRNELSTELNRIANDIRRCRGTIKEYRTLSAQLEKDCICGYQEICDLNQQIAHIDAELIGGAA